MTSVSPTPARDDKHPSSISTNLPMSLHHNQPGQPSSPHTPQHHLRSNNSSFASNASTFRGDEDAIIFEIGSRSLRAGFEGDSTPMCLVAYGPEDSRRVGDYRGWLKGDSDASRPQPVKAEGWTGAYELWKMDLRDVDLGLIEDKIERVFRETYNKYLLTDVGTSRLVLVLPSIMPHPLLSLVLSTLFSRWRFPSITLLPSAAMATIAAGVRSALVVDIGWAETTVTGIYEYREVVIKRSTRAMKSLLQETGRLLTRLSSDGKRESNLAADGISVGFEYCEEVVSRFAWCKARAGDKESSIPSNSQQTQSPTDDERTSQASFTNRMVSIPSPSDAGSTYIDLPFSQLSEPVEKVLFADGMAECDLDDQEKPIPLLVYNTLLALPPDVRGTCMSRIIFVGGGANIPGIRQRILKEVAILVEQHGWSQVRGKVIEQQRQRLQSLRLSKQPSTSSNDKESTPEPSEPAPEPEHQEGEEEEEEEEKNEAEIDFIEQKLQRNNKDKDLKPGVHGILREVESLGSWAGASLLTNLKVRGQVEIEREKYLQHGLAGASRDPDTHGHVPDRRSGLRTGGDRSSWTLAGWG